MGQTSKYKIPYPDVNDIANIPGDLQKIAEKIEAIIQKHVMTNENAEDLISKVEQLQTENNELSNNMPWNATSGKSLHITDSAKYSKNKLEISGDLEQEKSIEGKNKCKTDFVNWESGDYSNIDGSKSKFIKRIRLINLLKVEPNTTYYFNTFSDGYSFIVRGFDSAKTFTHSVGEIKNGQTYTTSNAEHYLGISIFNTNNYDITYSDYETSFNNSTIKPFICLDNEADKTFEEYIPNKPSTEFPSMPLVCTGAQKIKQFEDNWFNKNNISKINAVVDTSSIAANSSGKTFYIKIEPDTYTVSRKVIGARFVVGTTANIPKVGETIIDRIVNNNGSSITLTTSKNANYLVVYYLYNSSENEQEILDSIQIERGPKATKCKSYIEEINTLDLGTTELCAIKDINGNVVAQDRIVYKDNKWQFEKNAAIHTIDKTLLKQTSTSTNGKYRYQYFQIKNNVATAKDKNPGVCNIFSLARDGQTYNCEKGFTAITGVWNFYDEGETLEEFITKTENVDIVVTYITKEPIYEYCTSAQSEVLDKLYNNFKLQKGVNNIIVESENGVGVNLELEYMQDLQTKLNLLEAMCVSNASQEV